MARNVQGRGKRPRIPAIGGILLSRLQKKT
jgi:hypothetical protein